MSCIRSVMKGNLLDTHHFHEIIKPKSGLVTNEQNNWNMAVSKKKLNDATPYEFV
jgi:hypothetical protein